MSTSGRRDRILRLPSPHPGQQIVLASQKRFRLLAAGRRWRKTTLAMMTSVHTAIRGGTVLWGAPTFDQCRIGWRELERAAGEVAHFHQSRMEADFPDAGRIIFRSLDDPKHARGHTAHGVVIDEAPLLAEQVWYDVLRPTLSDTGGWALLMGTPVGHNWFWREHRKATEQRTPDTAAWQVPTLGAELRGASLIRVPHPMENPDFSFGELLHLHETLPALTFAQEFLAEFVSDAGLVFRGLSDVCLVSTEPPRPQHCYVFGVDWGKHNDFTALSVIDATARRQVALDRFNQIDYQVQLSRLQQLARQYRPQVICVEANAMGTPLIEQLERDRLPIEAFTTTAVSKKLAVEALALAIEKREVTLLDDPVQREELAAYRTERTPSGTYRYDVPRGMHDDTVVALMLAWWACRDEILQSRRGVALAPISLEQTSRWTLT